MNIKFLKIFIFVGLFFSLLTNMFAFDANINLDKSETDINDYTQLTIEVNSTEGGQIGISEIKGLENFEIVGQSQSQSSSSSTIIVNGNTQQEIKTTIKLVLSLKAKEKGEFEIGPAILKDKLQEVKTNTVKLKVSGDNLFINNNHLQVPTNKGTSIVQNVQNNLKDEKIDTFDNVKRKSFNNMNKIFLFISVIIIIGLLYLYLFKHKFIIKDNNKNIDKDLNYNSVENIDVIDFEAKQQSFKYPLVSDNEFIKKVVGVLNEKLMFKYNIKNIDTKTFNEILEEIGENKDNLEELFKMINKAKYSNIIGNNNKILEIIKNI